MHQSHKWHFDVNARTVREDVGCGLAAAQADYAATAARVLRTAAQPCGLHRRTLLLTRHFSGGAVWLHLLGATNKDTCCAAQSRSLLLPWACGTMKNVLHRWQAATDVRVQPAAALCGVVPRAIARVLQSCVPARSPRRAASRRAVACAKRRAPWVWRAPLWVGVRKRSLSREAFLREDGLPWRGGVREAGPQVACLAAGAGTRLAM